MTVATIPTLRSARLTLRALSEDDYIALFDLARDEAVSRYLHEGSPATISDIAARVARVLRQWELRGYGMMGVEDTEGFVGRLGVFHPAEAADPLLVYAFCGRGWGKGYATEGVGLFLRWMRATHGPLPLLAQIDPRNTASARVAAKLGGIKTGTASRGDVMLDVWAFRDFGALPRTPPEDSRPLDT